MDKSDRQRILHIKNYCKDIAMSIQRFGAKYDTFVNDTDYFNSVSMSIMQIGELSVGLSSEFKESTKCQMQWGMIRGMRNLFAHAYMSMSKEAIWETAVNDIPSLLIFCNNVIEQDQAKDATGRDTEKKSLIRKQLAEDKKVVAKLKATKTVKKQTDHKQEY